MDYILVISHTMHPMYQWKYLSQHSFLFFSSFLYGVPFFFSHHTTTRMENFKDFLPLLLYYYHCLCLLILLRNKRDKMFVKKEIIFTVIIPSPTIVQYYHLTGILPDTTYWYLQNQNILLQKYSDLFDFITFFLLWKFALLLILANFFF
jgi:hypothetical protein